MSSETASLYNQLGAVYFKTEQYDKAELNYMKSLRVFHE
jgi:Flp pilus assembly protein TadD